MARESRPRAAGVPDRILSVSHALCKAPRPGPADGWTLPLHVESSSTSDAASSGGEEAGLDGVGQGWTGFRVVSSRRGGADRLAGDALPSLHDAALATVIIGQSQRRQLARPNALWRHQERGLPVLAYGNRDAPRVSRGFACDGANPSMTTQASTSGDMTVITGVTKLY